MTHDRFRKHCVQIVTAEERLGGSLEKTDAAWRMSWRVQHLEA